MLKAFNWTIVSVPYYDWYGMDNSSVKASDPVLCITSDASGRNGTAMKKPRETACLGCIIMRTVLCL